MRIKRISVNRLFNMFNHVIPLKTKDRITIITGPNGFGKTAVLTLINGLFTNSLSSLSNIPFKELRIDFEDKSAVIVHQEPSNKKPSKSKRRRKPELTVTLLKNGSSKTYPASSQGLREVHIAPTIIDDMVRELQRVGPADWLDRSDDTILSLDDVLDRYGHRLPFPRQFLEQRREQEWFKHIKDSPPVWFIQTQRLLTIPTGRRAPDESRKIGMMSAVTKYSQELAEAIKGKLAESASLSQSLDRTFPTRLVKSKIQSTLSEDGLKRKLKELENRRLQLISSGLLDKGEEPIDVATQIKDDTTKRVLSVYIHDTEQKLSIFDEMSEKIELMKNIVNEHFLFKKLSISKEDGFVFVDSLDTRLTPAQLSSGEQHELVLLYELLFKVKSGSLILIDEPELSLHVGWQEMVLKDLGQIAELADLDIIIATHSPQIIHDRWDLTVTLKGPLK
jgi:predicted ATP-binding protein involved in virulence